MTRDEYLVVLATEPATGNQVGAVIGEFARLGVVDRTERLAISAALLGLDELRSTADLVMGQAGQLVNMLRHIGDRSELPEITAAAGGEQDHGHEVSQGSDGGEETAEDGYRASAGERVTLAGLIKAIAVMLAVGLEGSRINAAARKTTGTDATT